MKITKIYSKGLPLITVDFNLPTSKNKAGYTATPVACGWAGAIIEVRGAFGQEQ